MLLRRSDPELRPRLTGAEETGRLKAAGSEQAEAEELGGLGSSGLWGDGNQAKKGFPLQQT